jgi:hypothetical protein
MAAKKGAGKQTTPPSTQPDRDKTFAIMKAHQVVYPVTMGNVHIPYPVTPLDAQDARVVREAAAALLGKPPSQADDPEVEAVLAATRETAEQTASLVNAFVDGYIAHFEAIGCGAEGYEDYFRFERRTLGSLYHLATKPVASPMGLQRLALRFALDAREPVDGYPGFLDVQRTEQGWRVARMGSPMERYLPAAPDGRGRLIQTPYATVLLDLVFKQPPDTASLVRVIEGAFRSIPSESDSLEVPRFMYEIARRDPKPLIQLFLGDQEIVLPNWHHLHKLLLAICLDPDAVWTTEELRDKHGVTNASQAVTAIRDGLRAALPEAADWLLTRPHIHWAGQNAPSLRRAASANENKKK